MKRAKESDTAPGTAVYYTEMESPIGPLTLCATEAGLCLIEFGTMVNTRKRIEKWLAAHMGQAVLMADDLKLNMAKTQLEDYFAGRLKDFALALDMRGTAFQLRVWEALCSIPYGASVSYKDIAVQIGNPQAVRAVGGANNRNPVPVVVPCHRVIGAGGAMVGYGGGLDIKTSLLELEALQAGTLLF
ncbi:[Fe-S]-binding protein [Paenibacillus sp. PK3_47]|uniref:methylated-DNA--[protein]-cysteine S-methyltransferase n=1 Tax=Paenibacillus sp. PK3_47 TaxID=2072642 RepID=UPI00201D6130|nr:methylated-DNA--[protein]-cysteine S-methyltransferase [Paenibacillus sp. PK3_47]UQZ34725.1 [Fe-S]-binding protein [Paenibacillus sp. PK3_47]